MDACYLYSFGAYVLHSIQLQLSLDRARLAAAGLLALALRRGRSFAVDHPLVPSVRAAACCRPWGGRRGRLRRRHLHRRLSSPGLWRSKKRFSWATAKASSLRELLAGKRTDAIASAEFQVARSARGLQAFLSRLLSRLGNPEHPLCGQLADLREPREPRQVESSQEVKSARFNISLPSSAQPKTEREHRVTE